MLIAFINPEIPQNAGNMARLSAVSGSKLLLVGKLGFELSNSKMKRAGLDYWDKMTLLRVNTFEDFLKDYPREIYSYCMLTKFATKPYTERPLEKEPIVILGSESSGLPIDVKERFPEDCYRIPMKENIRSMNVANAASVVVFDILRRGSFNGLK